MSQPRFDRKEVARICEERGYHPIHHLINLATDPESSGYLQKECASEIASYLMPKLKTVQLTDNDGENASITIRWDNQNVVKPEDAYDDAKQQFSDGMRDATERIIEAAIEDDDETPT
jgi:hypothetical protein